MIVQDNILYYLEWNEYHDTIINQINLVDGTSKRFKLPFTEGQIAIIDDWMYIYLTHPDSVDVGYTGRFNLRTEELEYLIEEKLVYQLADEL